MTKTKLEMIKEFGRQVENISGVEISSRVLAGAETLTHKICGTDISLWVRDAIDRLDTLAPIQERVKIMENCGYNCSHYNYSAISRGKARRAKFENEAAFLTAEARKPQAGTHLEQEGNVLIQTYTPQSFSRPMRCYCGLLRELPPGDQISPTYCYCSKAFVMTFWSEVLGHPVVVDILETAVTGSTKCKFKIII